MEKTWRWFGPNDKITLSMLRQIGVEGVVTALHDVPNGDVWSLDAVMRMRDFIESAGLHWSVVESLPVSESIKYGGRDRDQLIDNYIHSLTNLGKAGVRTVCYNFMPVLDWARTDLEHPNSNGTSSLYFSLSDFAYFDCCILARPNADESYDFATLKKVEHKKSVATSEDNHRLVENIIIKTQGFVNGNIREEDRQPIQTFRRILSLYDGVDRDCLRGNLRYFLAAIMPICEEYGIHICIHPDDPPMPILGLPRIVTCEDDIKWLLDAVPNPHNGLTFCAGSLSSGQHNDVPKLASKFASRTKFVHLRSTDTLPNGDFKEASHLSGRAHIIDLVRIFEKVNPSLPMRVDHAPLMLGDESLGYNAGYSFHGRMLALGQIEGVMAVVRKEIEERLI